MRYVWICLVQDADVPRVYTYSSKTKAVNKLKEEISNYKPEDIEINDDFTSVITKDTLYVDWKIIDISKQVVE